MPLPEASIASEFASKEESSEVNRGFSLSGEKSASDTIVVSFSTVDLSETNVIRSHGQEALLKNP